ncbi:protein O-linked-mannose beta-1,2-N-acetylglucosaminyltransferase 1-like [Cherax quadricarinatus]|uniref:protein O-linked-mannose beta-1,2-N-acetylglucosaminyltransferase 1-like n=1 Tax=Cherax quadricarinatus TaxID=27406 RepID=UPI00387EB6E5
MEVWSATNGWGLKVERCHPYTHPNTCDTLPPFITQGLTLPPEEAHPHTPPTQGEGITLSVINQRKPALIFHRVFPLGLYWAHWADLEWHLERVAPGRVVVMTVSVFGTIGLRHAAQRLTQLGSVFALYLMPSARWTWVFIKGGRTISETVILQGIAQHKAHLILPLSHMPMPWNSNKNQRVEEERWQYCEAHGAMGGLCDEWSPDPLPLPSAPPVGQQTALAGVGVVVTAGNRHQYLYHTLTTLLATPGAQQHNVLVILGDAPPSTTQLLRLLDLNFTKVAVQGQDNAKLFRYYRSVFQLAVNTFPDAPAVIFLDEDVEVSPDFFSFMSQTLWLLHADPTIYCINAFSNTGFSNRTFNPSRVFRGSVQVMWGYAVTPQFIHEALIKWPKDEHNTNIIIYDFWLYSNVRRGRECVFPEVGRSSHYGMGTNSVPLMVEVIFLNRPVVQESGVPLVGVSRLQLPTWRHDLSNNLTLATPLLGNPCSADFIPKHNPEQLYVFYYRLDAIEQGLPDASQFFALQNCVGGWALSDQGQHEGVSILAFSIYTTLYLVGVPFSSYSHLKPRDLPLWDVNTIPEEEFEVVQLNELNKHKFIPVIANRNMTSSYLMSYLSAV